MARLLLWLIPALLYGAFAFWYTNTGGPLTGEEIARHLARFQAMGYDQAQLQAVERFMREDQGRQFLMVNAIDLKDALNETQAPGKGQGETPQRLMDSYMAFMLPALTSRACHLAFLGSAVGQALDLAGIEGAENWDVAGVMRYRSRRDLVEITSDPAFEESHAFKVAALAKTIAYPVEAPFHPGDLRFLLGITLLALVALLHLLFFRRKPGGA